MSEMFEEFSNELRTKVNDADKRLKELKANIASKADKSKVQVQAHMTAIDNKVKDGKARAAAAEAKMKTWAEEKKTMTQDKIAQWKDQRNVKKLAAQADRSEEYAIAAMQFAGAAVDEAERAIVEAIVARMDANSVAMTSASANA